MKAKLCSHVRLLATHGLQPTRLLHPWIWYLKYLYKIVKTTCAVAELGVSFRGRKEWPHHFDKPAFLPPCSGIFFCFQLHRLISFFLEAETWAHGFSLGSVWYHLPVEPGLALAGPWRHPPIAFLRRTLSSLCAELSSSIPRIQHKGEGLVLDISPDTWRQLIVKWDNLLINDRKCKIY